MGDRPLIVVAGPTGSGKSSLALFIAETFDGEIVNADSVQMYRGFDIGSAKLPAEERRGIPHHLIDVLDPTEVSTAGDFARRARAVIRGISDRGRLPVVAGGTGFYVRALLEGLFAGPPRNEDLRASLNRREERRAGLLWRALKRYDPAAAARIHRNDTNKLVRALEVRLVTGQPMTGLFEQGRDPFTGYAPLKIFLDPPRSGLYLVLERRSEAIFEAGLIEEVAGLLSKGVPADAKPFESIGYQQALRVVRGEMTSTEALEEMRRDTRRYAKRQLTWWRREKDSQTVQDFGTGEAARHLVADSVRSYLQQFT